MNKKECNICFEKKNLVIIHHNHSCCNECLNSIVINPYYSHEDGAICKCPFCRCIIYETNDKNINTKLKYLYIKHIIVIDKIYRRPYRKNDYRYSKRIDKDMLKSIKQKIYFNNKIIFKKNKNYKKKN